MPDAVVVYGGNFLDNLMCGWEFVLDEVWFFLVLFEVLLFKIFLYFVAFSVQLEILVVEDDVFWFSVLLGFGKDAICGFGTLLTFFPIQFLQIVVTNGSKRDKSDKRSPKAEIKKFRSTHTKIESGRKPQSIYQGVLVMPYVNIKARIFCLKQFYHLLTFLKHHFVPDFQIVRVMLEQNWVILIKLRPECTAFGPVFAIWEIFPLQWALAPFDSDAYSLWPIMNIAFSLAFFIVAVLVEALHVVPSVVSWIHYEISLF